MSEDGLQDILELRQQANSQFRKRNFNKAKKIYVEAVEMANTLGVDGINQNSAKLDKDGEINDNDLQRLKAMLFYNAAVCCYNLGNIELTEHYNYMSIAEDPTYPWALHRLVLLHEREGNYQSALNSAYESQDMRIYDHDVKANEVFSKTIERLERLIEKHGPVNEDLQPKSDDEDAGKFQKAMKDISDMSDNPLNYY